MPIYDFNGTTNQEIGKLFDYNGTTANQIAKVYDNNNSSNSLVYQNAFWLVKDTVDQGLLVNDYNYKEGNGASGWNASTCQIYCYTGYNVQSCALRYYFTSETKGRYSTARIQGSGVSYFNSHNSNPSLDTCLWVGSAVITVYQPTYGQNTFDITAPIDSTQNQFTLWANANGGGEIWFTINNFWLE